MRRPRPNIRIAILATSMLVSALAVMVGAAGPSAADAPGVAVDPAYGPPLTTIKVTGAHFCGSPCGPAAIVIANLTVADNIPVSPDGTFTTFVRVPGTARPGAVPVLVSQTAASGATQTARDDFTVTVSTPAPTIYPPPATGQVPSAGTPAAGIPPSSPASSLPGPNTGTGRVGGPGPKSTADARGYGPAAPRVDRAARTSPAGTSPWWIVLLALAVVAAAGLAAVVWRHRRQAG
jgi:hypothetical protein